VVGPAAQSENGDAGLFGVHVHMKPIMKFGPVCRDQVESGHIISLRIHGDEVRRFRTLHRSPPLVCFSGSPFAFLRSDFQDLLERFSRHVNQQQAFGERQMSGIMG